MFLAIALNAGYLVTTVLDTVENGMTILLLDTSPSCHMPDVLEMPYRPPLKDSGEAGEKKYTYRLSSCTCLAGDVIGDYSFDTEVKPGDRLYFEDMAIYSMVKNNTFNGIALPSIYAMDEDGECRLIKEFTYEDFKGKLFNAKDDTFYGLTGMGDLILTCNSKNSRNFSCGYQIGLEDSSENYLKNINIK